MNIRYTGNAFGAMAMLKEQIPVVIEGVEPFKNAWANGWIKRFPDEGRHVLYEPPYWEEVPHAPVWRDVTDECEISEYMSASSEKMFSILNDEMNVLHKRNGYRLEKILISRGNEEPRYAFVVAKQVKYR